LFSVGLWVVAIGWTRGPNQGGGRLLIATVLAGALAALLALDATSPVVANTINPDDDGDWALPPFPIAPVAPPNEGPGAPNTTPRTEPGVGTIEGLAQLIAEPRALLSSSTQQGTSGKVSEIAPRIALPGRPDFETDIPNHLFRPQGPKLTQGPTSATQGAANHPAVERLAKEVRGHAAEVSEQIKAALLAATPGLAPEVLASHRLNSAVPWAAPLVIREYAAARPGIMPGEQSTDTILWQPVIVLPSDGKTTLTFHTGTAPGGYQVVVAGHTLDGRIGTKQLILPTAPGVAAPPGMPK
jgi:hypothetical protein